MNKIFARFDLCALLKELENQGYLIENILFRGGSGRSSSAALCEEIVFSPDSLSAVMTLNLGLLTGSSPLPTYYQKAMEQGEIDEESFIAFLQFFNHHLIKDFLNLSMVEQFLFSVQSDRSLHHRQEPIDWKGIQLENIMMLGLDSVSSMHWLFSLCFPELEIVTKKCTRNQKVHYLEFGLGISKLDGKSAMGGYIAQKVAAYQISLTAEGEQTDNQEFWPKEIRKRLKELIFTVLCKVHIYLNVYFTITQYNRAAYLNRHNHVGYTSLGETTSNFTWLLYEGIPN